MSKYQIAGVDEADISKGKVYFISPITKLLTDKKVGDKAILKLEKEDRTLNYGNRLLIILTNIYFSKSWEERESSALSVTKIDLLRLLPKTY